MPVQRTMHTHARVNHDVEDDACACSEAKLCNITEHTHYDKTCQCTECAKARALLETSCLRKWLLGGRCSPLDRTVALEHAGWIPLGNATAWGGYRTRAEREKHERNDEETYQLKRRARGGYRSADSCKRRDSTSSTHSLLGVPAPNGGPWQNQERRPPYC